LFVWEIDVEEIEKDPLKFGKIEIRMRLVLFLQSLNRYEQGKMQIKLKI